MEEHKGCEDGKRIDNCKRKRELHVSAKYDYPEEPQQRGTQQTGGKTSYTAYKGPKTGSNHGLLEPKTCEIIEKARGKR
jgi:hypothetical protein